MVDDLIHGEGDGSHQNLSSEGCEAFIVKGARDVVALPNELVKADEELTKDQNSIFFSTRILWLVRVKNSISDCVWKFSQKFIASSSGEETGLRIFCFFYHQIIKLIKAIKLHLY